MKRLLCIVGSMNAGGAETFLMKVYRKLDRTKYQMDFAVAVADKGFYDDEILAMGGRIFHITPKSTGAYRNFKNIMDIVKENHYNYVLRTSQHSLSALELLAAKLGGAKVRVFRSSNSNTTTSSRKQLMIHSLCRFMPRLFANVRIAPSTEAAEYMFGKGCIKNKKASLLYNGIDLDFFKFNKDARALVRREFGINDDTLLLGHVGRFNQQKNHSFLIEIFKEVKKYNPKAVLLLVGKGELEQEIKDKVERFGLSKSVIFAGMRSDMPWIFSAMDIYIFPSYYEGMPNTVIEAQGCALPCVISDTITREVCITDLIKYQSLGSTVNEWAKEVLLIKMNDRNSIADNLREQGYDILDVTNDFVEKVFNVGD